jgi:hypothetical protein
MGTKTVNKKDRRIEDYFDYGHEIVDFFMLDLRQVAWNTGTINTPLIGSWIETLMNNPELRIIGLKRMGI